MTLKEIIHISPHSISQLDPTEFTLAQIRESISLNSTFYILVSDDSVDTLLDLPKLLLETTFGKCTTFDEILENLTETIMTTYKAEISAYSHQDDITDRYLRTIILGDTNLFDVHYTDINQPSLKDDPQRKWKLKDLEIIARPNDEQISIENCIPVMNGLMFRPQVFNDRMYVKEGATFLWGTDRDLNSLVIDTSKMGGHSLIPMSDCELLGKSPTDGSVNLNAPLRVKLPGDEDLKDKSLLLVMQGRLLLPTIDFHRDGSHSVTINSHAISGEHFVEYESSRDNCVPQLDMVFVDADKPAEYFTEEMFDPNCNNAFFIVLNCPSFKFRMTKVFKDVINSMMWCGPDVKNGLLINNTTKKIMAYHSLRYDTSKVIYTETPKDHIYPITDTPDPDHLGYGDIPCFNPVDTIVWDLSCLIIWC